MSTITIKATNKLISIGSVGLLMDQTRSRSSRSYSRTRPAPKSVMVDNGIPRGYGIPARDPSSRGDDGTTRRPSHDPKRFSLFECARPPIADYDSGGEEILVEPTHASCLRPKTGQR